MLVGVLTRSPRHCLSAAPGGDTIDLGLENERERSGFAWKSALQDRGGVTEGDRNRLRLQRREDAGPGDPFAVRPDARSRRNHRRQQREHGWTRAVADRIPGVRWSTSRTRGWCERGRRDQAATGDVLLYIDADCRAPVLLVEHGAPIPAVPADGRGDRPVPVLRLGLGRHAGARVYDYTLAPFAHVTAHHVLRIGAILYGGNFAVRRTALDAIGGFDTSIEFHGEDTNLGRRLARSAPSS